jgi:hypothetical protein
MNPISRLGLGAVLGLAVVTGVTLWWYNRPPTVIVYIDPFSDRVLRIGSNQYATRSKQDEAKIEVAVGDELGGQLEQYAKADCRIVGDPDAPVIDVRLAFTAMISNGVLSAKWVNSITGQSAKLKGLAGNLQNNFSLVINELGDAAYIYRNETWAPANGGIGVAWMHITSSAAVAFGKNWSSPFAVTMGDKLTSFRWIVLIDANAKTGDAVDWLNQLQRQAGEDNVLPVFF